jgi:hypothetical protein
MLDLDQLTADIEAELDPCPRVLTPRKGEAFAPTPCTRRRLHVGFCAATLPDGRQMRWAETWEQAWG